jgi:hypothetical protein
MTDPILQWADALESGDYKQTYQILANTEDGFCCLGVAVDKLGYGFLRYTGIRNSSVGGQEVRVACESGSYSMPGFGDFPPEMEVLWAFINNHGQHLSSLNDSYRLSFWDIAQWIRKTRKYELDHPGEVFGHREEHLEDA